jgi:preprotein translocase subunit SecG
METVIIVIHLMVIVALVAVVLLQRSEGGALGIGGGNAFLTSRGQGNVLTRATGILAAAFFATSIALSVLNRFAAPPSSILDTTPAPTTQTAPTTVPDGTNTTTAPTTSGGAGGILNELNKFTGQTPPAGTTTTTPPATGDTTTVPPATVPPVTDGTTPPAQPIVPTTP